MLVSVGHSVGGGEEETAKERERTIISVKKVYVYIMRVRTKTCASSSTLEK